MKNSKLKIAAAIITSTILAASPAAAQTGTVIADLLNVRSGPSTSSEVIDMLSWGDSVLITYGPTSDGWYEIYKGGTCAYVCASYISGGGSYSSASGNSSSYDYDSAYDYDSSSYDYDDSYDDYEETSSYSSGGTYLGNFTLTAYCNCAACCGTAGNATASGVYPTSGHTVAMGGVPFGTELLINGHVYTVEDRGTPYGHVDIYFDSHQEALDFGLQYADVYQLN